MAAVAMLLATLVRAIPTTHITAVRTRGLLPWTTGVISSTSQAEIPVDSAAMASAILRAAARMKMMDQPIFLENSWTAGMPSFRLTII